jgi:hypothetical protein
VHVTGTDAVSLHHVHAADAAEAFALAPDVHGDRSRLEKRGPGWGGVRCRLGLVGDFRVRGETDAGEGVLQGLDELERAKR